MEDFKSVITALESQCTDEHQKDIFENIIDKTCEYLADLFEVDQTEIAIIILTNNEKFLRFIAPKKLYKGGATFPLSKRESLSTKVMLTKKSDIKNDVINIKHLSIYEQVKTSEEKPKPIQKMLTVPLIHEDKAVGVIQISKKGLSPDEAGQDFSDIDVQKLLSLIPSFLPSLIKTKPHSI